MNAAKRKAAGPGRGKAAYKSHCSLNFNHPPSDRQGLIFGWSLILAIVPLASKRLAPMGVTL